MHHAPLRRRSIKAQLILAIVLATAVAGLVAAGLSVMREVDAYAAGKRVELRALSGLIAAMVADGVEARDNGRVQDAFSAMTSMPGIVHVRVSDAAGGMLAEHGLGSRLVARGDGLDLSSLLAGEPAVMTGPVIRGGRVIGEVELLAATTEFRSRIVALLLNTGVAAVLAIVLGVAAAYGLQRSIARRIGAVAQTMTMVQRTHRYDLKLDDRQPDEIGALADGFNRMMGEIRLRDDRLTEHRANLESEVDRRTFDLQVAKQAADEANAAKSQFLATMSHEIRTPLNGLMVMAELLAAADLAPRERRYADVVVRSGGGLLAIINDVLDYAKIEAGKIELEAIPLDLADVVDDVAQLFASKAAGQGLDLAAFIHPSIGRVIGDPVRIGQIIGNLVNNAIKFTKAGHVLIEVEPHRLLRGQVLFKVTDTGIGIPAEKLSRVFESFSQANQSTTREYGGTGLGLSICQRLVAVMDGEIGVESREGEGSCFWFSAPLPPAGDAGAGTPRFTPLLASGASAAALGSYAACAAARAPGPDLFIVDPRTSARPPAGARVIALSRVGDATADQWLLDGRALAQLPWPVRRSELIATLGAVARGETRLQTVPAKMATGVQYRDARVLVVDDGAVNREVALEALKRFGVLADIAVDGPDALRKAEAATYDLIFMDGSMPGMDGFETSRRIRALESSAGRKRQAIVALTAHAIGDGADAWRAADMDGLLLKPFNLAQLGARLAEHLRPAATAPSGSAPPEPAAGTALDMSSADILDAHTMETFAMLASADASAVQRIVHIFAEHAPQALDRLIGSLGSGSGETIASAAHALKSMTMSVGALGLAEKLGAMEKAARRGEAIPSATELDGVRRNLAEVVAALDAMPWMAGADKEKAAHAA
jgi:two-component system sensor histidine kinase BarA